jgi:predicted metalloprotease with PDZ domain
MRYRVSMPEPHSHLFHVEVVLEQVTGPAQLVFPVWTPGSYMVREFARHIEGIQAEDASGRAFVLERLDKNRFQVPAFWQEPAVVRFRVYANELTVRTCHLDGTHGFFNPAALLPYLETRRSEPHVLELVPPAGWEVATALPGGPRVFTARDYDELADSPVEVGRHALSTFDALGKPHAIAVHGRGNIDLPRFERDVRRIVETVGGFMGGLPYERYLFIVHLNERRGGGLEHAASTTLNVQRNGFFPAETYQQTLALVAHEFFHLWNVKRLRPAAFTPYDYTREQYTRLLWWFEGATSYYDELFLVRAGLTDRARYLRYLGEQLTALARTPGMAKMSLEEASFTAWIKYYRPDENSANSSISYYAAGEVAAWALDLMLRRSGSSLDVMLRRLWDRYAGTGVPEDGIERVLAELIGEGRARRFFDRHVRGTEPAELDLDLVGLRIQRRPVCGLDDRGGTPNRLPEPGPVPGWLGADLPSGPRLLVGSVREGSPAHRAGLYAGDELIAESGFRVDRNGLWDRLLERGPQGALRLTVFRRDELVEVEVPLAAAPEEVVYLEPVPEPTPAQRQALEDWIA